MTTTDNTKSDWRTLTDKLTPEQGRHLEADERLAAEALNSTEAHAQDTGREMLDSLYDEAVFYAQRNAPVGIEAPEPVEVLRSLLGTIEPAALTHADRAALLDLVAAAFR